MNRIWELKNQSEVRREEQVSESQADKLRTRCGVYSIPSLEQYHEDNDTDLLHESSKIKYFYIPSGEELWLEKIGWN